MAIHNFFFITVAILLASSPAFSEPNWRKTGKVKTLTHLQFEKKIMQSAPWTDSKMTEVSEESFRKMVKMQLEKSSFRSPAADLEGSMTPEFKAIRDQIINVKTSQELHSFLNEVDAKLQDDTFKEADTRFFMSQLVVFKAFRGVIYRLYQLAHSNKVTHSVLLSQVKGVYTTLDFYFPNQNQWKAGFDYLTEPYVVNGQVVQMFENEVDVQSYISTTIFNAIRTANERVAAVDLSKSLRPGYVVWDNQIVWSSQTFDRDVDRYRLAGNIEKLAVMGFYERAMAQISLKRAYSMNEYFKVAHEVGRLYGLDGFVSEVDGVPMAKFVQVYRKYPNYGAGFADRKRWTEQSLRHFRLALSHYKNAFELLERRESNERYVIAGAHIKVFGDVTKKSIAQLDQLINSPKQPVLVQSRVRQGRAINVNLPQFFNDPPLNLLSMMSTSWKGYSDSGKKTGNEWSKINLEGNIQGDKRDYSLGQATGWDLNVYRKVFPNVVDGADLKENVRILSESWGGSFAGLPFTEYVR